MIYNDVNAVAPYVPGTIRQILAPQVCADVVMTGTNKSEIKIYHRGQLKATPNTGIRQFSGDPFAWYAINPDTSNTNTITIRRDWRDFPASVDFDDGLTTAETTSLTGLSYSNRKFTLLERTGTAPSFTWKADDWYDNGSSSISRSTWSRTGNSETVTLAVPSGATALSKSRTYTGVGWGEEITSETVGTTNGVTTNYSYYTASGSLGSYSKLKSMAHTGDSWEAYEYYEYGSGVTGDAAGTLQRRHRPFGGSNTSVPGTLSSHTAGEVTSYEYGLDAFGRKTRPTLVETKINGQTVQKTTTSYSSAASGFSNNPNLYVVTATRNDYDSGSNSISTITKYFREDSGSIGTPWDDFFRNQVHSIAHPDGTKQSFAYQRGSWDGTTFTKSGTQGTSTGLASRIAIISGTTGTSNYSTHETYDIDDIRLIDGKSTLRVIIRDEFSNVARTESHVRSGGNWHLLDYANYSYNNNLQLTQIGDRHFTKAESLL